MGSIVIGAIGILMGAQLASLVKIEGLRGNLAGWALLAFGLVYFAWGMKQAGRASSIRMSIFMMMWFTITNTIITKNIYTYTMRTRLARSLRGQYLLFSCSGPVKP